MKALIIYTSKKGATKKCAEIIKSGLTGNVDLKTIDEAKQINLSDYEKIVFGTPIYAGMVDKAFKEYLTAQEAVLQKKKVYLYLCSMDTSQKQVYLENNLSKEQIALFDMTICAGGAFYFSKMNFFEKMIIKKIANSEKGQKDFHQKVDGKTDIEMYAEDEIKLMINRING